MKIKLCACVRRTFLKCIFLCIQACACTHCLRPSRAHQVIGLVLRRLLQPPAPVPHYLLPHARRGGHGAPHRHPRPRRQGLHPCQAPVAAMRRKQFLSPPPHTHNPCRRASSTRQCKPGLPPKSVPSLGDTKKQLRELVPPKCRCARICQILHSLQQSSTPQPSCGRSDLRRGVSLMAGWVSWPHHCRPTW